MHELRIHATYLMTKKKNIYINGKNFKSSNFVCDLASRFSCRLDFSKMQKSIFDSSVSVEREQQVLQEAHALQ